MIDAFNIFASLVVIIILWDMAYAYRVSAMQTEKGAIDKKMLKAWRPISLVAISYLVYKFIYLNL